MRIKKNINFINYKLIQYQILHANITRTVWQTVRRINNEILGVKGLNPRSDWHLICPKSNTTQSFIKIMRIREIIFKLWNSDC